MNGSPIWVALGWTMIHFLWAGTATWFAAGCVLRLLPCSAPLTRYGAALGGLLLLAALPLAIFVVVYVGQSAGMPVAPPVRESASGSARIEAAPEMAPPVRPLAASPSGIPPPQGLTAAPVVALLPWIWGLGATVMLAMLACGGAGIRRLVRGARILDPGPWTVMLERLRLRLGLGREVAIAASDRILTPLVAGVLRPLILLPASLLSGWTPAEVEMVLLHELAHVRRCDNLVNFGQRLLEAILFFHPAVWSLSRCVRQEREACCDDAVLAGSGRRREYAALLLRLVPAKAAGIAASALSGSDVLIRIRRILEQESPMPRLQRMLALSGAAAGFLLLVVAARAQVPEPDPRNLPHAVTIPGIRAPVPEGIVISPHTGDQQVKKAARPMSETCIRGDEAKTAAAKCTDCHVTNPHFPAGWRPSAPASAAAQDCRQCHATVSELWPPTHPAQKRSWGPEQACGAPDTPEAGDHPTAWASESEDLQDEWLELRFAETVEPVAVEIHESHNPGAVSRVLAVGSDGTDIEIWSGVVKIPIGARSWTSVIPIEKTAPTNRIRIEVASKRVPGWNEIDAVGLRAASGRVHWAKDARASSTYADVADIVEFHFPLRSIPAGDAETQRLKREIKATQDRLAEALRRLAELERRLNGPR